MARKIGSTEGESKPRIGRKGFEHASRFMASDLRRLSEDRGFAETRLLSQWKEIAGTSISAFTRPVKVSFAKGAFGATLTIQVQGARAPEVEMQTGWLRERINACYGYAAISRIRLIQGEVAGFSEGAASFQHKQPSAADPDEIKRMEAETTKIHDSELREQLKMLGRNVMSSGNRKGTPSDE